ncbi:MAG: hypothetical protein HC872_06275 [Gammaproteobacteria bacterium]|nr:hypothetical protein [Gammaproteobacteria bacterium]
MNIRPHGRFAEARSQERERARLALSCPRAAGARVTGAVRHAADGSCTGPVVDLTAGSTCTLAINDFIASGGDGYPVVTRRPRRHLGSKNGGRFKPHRTHQNGTSVDFDAVAEHLYELSRAARASKLDLALVIFDPKYLPRLYASRRGAYLRENVRFMQGRPWVRHDDHYHVDFAVRCDP